MFCVQVLTAALVILIISGDVHCFPGIPFQLPKQENFLPSVNYQSQTGNGYNNQNMFSQPHGDFSNKQNGINHNVQYSNLNSARSVQPIVTKHIYFHVAPPDQDEIRQAHTKTYRKNMNYNILFIKLPSQQRKNQVKLQEMMTNQYSAEKTLIYVLVKNPEQQSVYKPSNHEVFYVKYKGSPNKDASPLQTNSFQSLQPGMING